MKEQYNDYFYVSCLNVISCIAVVILHANGSFWKYRNDFSWAINNFIECTFYFAVPVFFMITGVTLYDYPEKYNTKVFFKKRIIKTFIPFIFWGLVAFILLFIKEPKKVLENGLRIDTFFNGIFGAEYFSYYWFFIPLFCIYLSIPLFANIEKSKKIGILKYLVCISFICDFLIPFIISSNILKLDISWGYNIPVMSGYLIYPTLGYLFHHYSLGKKQRVIIYIAALAGFMIHCFGTYYLSQEQGRIIEHYKGYLNLPCLLYSTGIFVFVKYNILKIKLREGSKFILHLQKYTFAIYLLHMFLFEKISSLLNKIAIRDTSSVLFILLMTIVDITTCIVITFLLRNFLKLKIIVP